MRTLSSLLFFIAAACVAHTAFAADTCEIKTSFTATTCTGNILGVEWTPNPSYCTASTCASDPSDLTPSHTKVECASTACEQPPSGGEPVSVTVSMYTSNDCSGSPVLSATSPSCKDNSQYFKSGGWLWNVEYDNDAWCDAKSPQYHVGNKSKWSKVKGGCIPFGTAGSMMISGAVHVGVTMAGVIMLIVGALFAL